MNPNPSMITPKFLLASRVMKINSSTVMPTNAAAPSLEFECLFRLRAIFGNYKAHAEN